MRAIVRCCGRLAGSVAANLDRIVGAAAVAESSPGCVDWRPSRLLAAGLVLIGLLGGGAVVASECPPRLAWPAAVLAAGWGALLARRELRRPPRRLRLAGARAWLDEAPIAQTRLHWRGPLIRLEFRAADGRRGRLLWWPDSLDAHGRRELRLAAAVATDACVPRSMAP
ncbi:toxin CptA [Lysobacter enzymogenes]